METRIDEVKTYSEVARDLGSDIRTISGLTKLLGIRPKPTPRNGNGRGLDGNDVKAIKAALEAGRRKLLRTA